MWAVGCGRFPPFATTHFFEKDIPGRSASRPPGISKCPHINTAELGARE